MKNKIEKYILTTRQSIETYNSTGAEVISLKFGEEAEVDEKFVASIQKHGYADLPQSFAPDALSEPGEVYIEDINTLVKFTYTLETEELLLPKIN